MTVTFFTFFGLLFIAELIKWLSANGTPPVLQRFSWQIHLAYFMWSNIKIFRVILVAVLVYTFFQLEITNIPLFILGL